MGTARLTTAHPHHQAADPLKQVAAVNQHHHHQVRPVAPGGTEAPAAPAWHVARAPTAATPQPSCHLTPLHQPPSASRALSQHHRARHQGELRNHLMGWWARRQAGPAGPRSAGGRHWPRPLRNRGPLGCPVPQVSPAVRAPGDLTGMGWVW